jgi:predicted dithiol-disulfide oxidoreductase (DUF899 family)
MDFHKEEKRDKIAVEVEKLEHEISIKKRELAELRRKLTPEKIQDYSFKNRNGDSVNLSELFGDKSELILIHNMGVRCPYCTMWADGFNGVYQHISDRAAFVLVSPDDYATQRSFSDSRGWRFPIYSARETEFIKDMGFLRDDGNYVPGFSIFAKDSEGNIIRTGKDYFGPFDDYCSAWNFFQMLPSWDGNWFPKFKY